MNRLLSFAAVALLASCALMCGSEDPGSIYKNGDPTGAIDAGGSEGGGSSGIIGSSGGPQGDGGSSGCGNCKKVSSGVGTADPFNLGTHENAGVGLDPSGAIILNPASTSIPNIIWIANTGMGTVTKVDTRSYKILARYKIGASGTTLDPSRTSVNSDGDVFVGNRAGSKLLKISAAGTKCPDTNKDGKVTTSTGASDVLDWGQDDCVLWDVDVPSESMVRGVAAQDREIPDPQIDQPNHVIVEHNVWTGGTTEPYTIRKYDGATGAVQIATKSPSSIYGLALDGTGQLWISGNIDSGGPAIGRVDTNKCKDQASCDAAEVCVSSCASSGACTCKSCSGACESAIKERIELPDSVYGITVDFKQRVWVGGSGVGRYDPKAPATQRYTRVPKTGGIHGLAADGKGWIWAADGGGSVYRVNGDTLDVMQVPNVPSKGMAVDKDGKIWSISYDDGASVIIPGPTINDNPSTTPAGNSAELGGDNNGGELGYCYTYSDMTGQQLALAANNPGYYREVMDNCPSGKTTWFDLDWNVTTPPGTTVKFLARTATTKDGLANAPWMTIASTPPANPPISLQAAFGKVPLQEFLEVEVQLQGFVGTSGLVGPVVSSFGVTKSCDQTAN